MSVSRIERIVGGVVKQTATTNKEGKYQCHPFGSNISKIYFSSLDDVAKYLKSNPDSGVRMNPGWSKISKNIFIDGIKR
ncbi:hypothetical protein GLF_0285 [Gluconobacter frateurii NBRC 101659]|nr:hypothetical protein GLF_0285 [Gluconobacter frateurii NBRC 101659]